MKIGYACLNNRIGCTSNRTFRLKNYSQKNLIKIINSNLECLEKILEFNLKNNLLFFRIGSGLVPFASHPINKFKWGLFFKRRFQKIGFFVKKNNLRLSMHPGQYTVINSEDQEIVRRSLKEISYHCQILELMGLDATHKVQIHVGGQYGDKMKAIQRFIKNYSKASQQIKKRLVIENDDRSFSIEDCLFISKKTKIPVVFDNLHHFCLSNGQSEMIASARAFKTWRKKDGSPMVDFSQAKIENRNCYHRQSIVLSTFLKFIKKIKNKEIDIILEIKDKEKSAFRARNILIENGFLNRFDRMTTTRKKIFF